MDWNALLRDILYAIITAAVPVVTVYFVKFLKTHFDKISVDTEDSIVSNTIDEALDLITKVVTSTSQTYVDALKSSGEFTKEAQAEAFNKTKTTILALLSTESKELLATLYSDLSTWLDVQIEAAVKNQKTKKEGE